MNTPTFNNKHLKEYGLFGGLAGFLYSIPMFLYLQHNSYENSYYLYIGNALFFLVIFYYNMKLLYRPYDKRRAVSMLMAGHLTTLLGVIVAVLLALTFMLFFFPDLFASKAPDMVLDNAPANAEAHRPSGWLFMIFINAVICNFGAGAMISIMVSYAGKKNQTKDKPAHLDVKMPYSNKPSETDKK